VKNKKMPIEDIVRGLSVDVGSDKVNANPSDSHYGLFGLEDYYTGTSEDVQAALEPWLNGLRTAVQMNGGSFQARDIEILSQLNQNARDYLQTQTVGDVFDAYARVGFDQDVPHAITENRNRNYGEFVQELQNRVQELDGVNPRDFTEEQRDLAVTYNAINQVRDRSKAHVEVNMDDKQTGQLYTAVNQAYNNAQE
jgi:hypothetical protein